MVFRRCPQCHSTTDDQYGFCIKCGCELPKIEDGENSCPYCGYSNPEEADFCVKCGTPLIFKSQFQKDNTALNPIVIKQEIINNAKQYNSHKTSRLLILLGYIFSIFGGIIGLIIAIYLSTRKDPVAKKHGHIQLAIFAFYIVLILILVVTGNITSESMNSYQQILNGNMTALNFTRF